MAKKKIRPHPGALTEVLKRLNMTQSDAASHDCTGIDRKTLAKINRGESVKEETLQTLADKLRVPRSHFDPPASDSVHRETNQPDDPLSLTLHKVDAEGLADLLKDNIRLHWLLNVHHVDDKTVPVLNQLEDAAVDLHRYLQFIKYSFVYPKPIPLGIDGEHYPDPKLYEPYAHRKTAATQELGSLKQQLDRLKKIKHVASLLEVLAKHRLTILGAEFLYWEYKTETEWHCVDPDPDPFIPDENYSTFDSYDVRPTALISIDEHSVQTRRVNVDRGREPPKFAPDRTTIIKVNGIELEVDPGVRQEGREKNKQASTNFALGPDASSEDGNDQ